MRLCVVVLALFTNVLQPVPAADGTVVLRLMEVSDVLDETPPPIATLPAGPELVSYR
jgi:hypothetical protein